MTILIFALPIVGFFLAVYLFWFWWPTFCAKRELRRYFESAKETFVYDGGLMHDCTFYSSRHKILVRFPKPAKPFQAEEAGKIMIQNINGKFFHLDWKHVDPDIIRFWNSCKNK